jgi:stage IV sporulation protein FB
MNAREKASDTQRSDATRAGRLSLRVDPLVLAPCIPAALFGYLGMLLCGFAAIVLHETAHLAFARLYGLRVRRLELTPFGGLAVTDDAPKPSAAFFIALSGPLANFLCVQILLLLFRASPSQFVRMLILANLFVGLFNLMPAYPLDGGRMLHILLTPLLGFERAKRFCCLLGMLTGLCILMLSAHAFITTGVVNLTFVSIGAMLLYLAIKQRRTDVYTALRISVHKRKRLRERPILARQVAVSGKVKAITLLKTLRRGEYLTACVLDDSMAVIGTLDETRILDGIVRLGSGCTLEKILDRQSTSRVN